jgi:hypothetical protein
MAAARWAAAALLALALVLGVAGQANPVVVASYGQPRLWLKPYDWSYLRGERVSGREFLFHVEILVFLLHFFTAVINSACFLYWQLSCRRRFPLSPCSSPLT